MKIFYVYIVECNNSSFYVGVTSNLQKRIAEHNSGRYRDSYTFQRRPVTLKWSEQFTDPCSAFQVEKQIKGWSRRNKIALIKADWEKLIQFSKNYMEYGKNDDSSTDA